MKNSIAAAAAVLTALCLIASRSRGADALPAKKYSRLSGVNFNIATYYNPRVNFGFKDEVPFHDDATATQWCRSVPGKKFTVGVSRINAVDPMDGPRYRWDGDRWLEVKGGDYPRVYVCADTEDLLRDAGL